MIKLEAAEARVAELEKERAMAVVAIEEKMIAEAIKAKVNKVTAFIIYLFRTFLRLNMMSS